MFRTIVIAIDGSDPSKRAIQAGCQIARAFGSEIHLVHAQEAQSNAGSEGPRKDRRSPELEEARALAEAAGVASLTATAVEGDPFEEIMTVVDLYSADLIITGRRGLGTIRGMLAGSTSQQIAKHANCAHLSVK